MKKINILALVFLALAACQDAEQKLWDQDITAIRSTLDKYVSTSLAADWDAWGTTIAPDAIFFPPNQEPLVGREAIVAWGRSFPKLTSFTATFPEISGYNDLAYASGPFSLTATIADGTSITDQGSHVEIFQKQPDGTWLYSRVIWHSNLPLPVAQPAN